MSDLISLDEMIARESPEVQEAIQRKFLELVQEEEDLRHLREKVRMTQAELAAKVGVTQGAVSKMERDADGLTLRNLRKIVRHLGGELDIVIRLPDSPPVRLRRLSDLKDPEG